MQSFKDPEGCVSFRKILQDFELNIKSLHKEKEIQYKHMRQSLRLFEQLEKSRKTKFLSEEEIASLKELGGVEDDDAAENRVDVDEIRRRGGVGGDAGAIGSKATAARRVPIGVQIRDQGEHSVRWS